ncbi:TPA: hypothetical protein ACX6RA_001550 [Photobacterium damselae]
MFVSKMVTFNKTSFLNRLSNEIDNSKKCHKEYFNIGHPIDSPPTLRGSMIIEFNMNFIFDNEVFFEYGSPIDIGSLIAGYITPHNFEVSDIKMNYCSFKRVLTDLTNINSIDKQAFLRHKITDSVHAILKNHTKNEVADFIRFDHNPHSRLFEFCLDGNYKIDIGHVKRIHVPNTYSNIDVIRKISGRFKGKVITFNPKYGFEGRYVA